MIERTVSHYKILAKLGDGGMGSVFRGIDLMLDRPVAIKVLHDSVARQADLIERFRAEAAMSARLSHPNIATVYSFFREGDEFFLVMEFVDGKTLATLMRSGSPPGTEQSVDIVSKILSGLEHAHSMGILHRDIKPANILVTADGNVKITDFGIARSLGSERMTRDLRVVGTPEYLAPERIQGEAGDIRSDIYSVGILLYELLAKRLPFEKNSDFELMRAHLEEAPTPLFEGSSMEIAPDLEAIVFRALAKKPQDRFNTAKEMRDTLTAASLQRPLPATRFADQAEILPQTRFADPMPPPAPPVSTPGRSVVSSIMARWIGIGAAGLVALVLVFFIMRFANRPKEAGTAAAGPVTDKPVSAAPVLEERPTPQPQAVPADATATISPGSVASPQDALIQPSADDRAEARKRQAERAKRRAAALQALDQ